MRLHLDNGGQITFSHKFEYISLRILERFCKTAPRGFGLQIGSLIGASLLKTGTYLKRVRANLNHVGIWDKTQQTEIERKLYSNFGRYAIDFLRGLEPLPPYTVHNYEIIASLQERNKGTIVLLGHFGNWELLADIFGKKIKNLKVVAKPMRNLLVDKWLENKRNGASVETIYTTQALPKMVRAIKSNSMVAILIDQHGGKHGNMVPFLGKEANTVRTVAGLVYKTGCGILPTYAIMDKKGHYTIEMSEALPIDTTGLSEDDAITRYQIQHNEILSGWIKQYPEHWFGWFHKRFRGSIRY